jgi:hypothetical protein
MKWCFARKSTRIITHILVQKSPIAEDPRPWSLGYHVQLYVKGASHIAAELQRAADATLMAHLSPGMLLDGSFDSDHKSHSIHFLDGAKS